MPDPNPTNGDPRAAMAAFLAAETVEDQDLVDALPNDGTLPFVLGDAMLETSRFRPEDLHLRAIPVGNTTFWALLGTTPDEQWRALGMEGNHLLDPGNTDYDAFHHGLDEALALLARSPRFFELVSTFVYTVVPIITTAKDPITSATLPDIPFGVFMSPRALVHIPPLSITDAHSVAIMAENLVHEATHNMVSKDILTRDLIVEDYDSATSPKIPIPWRENMGSAWELDRMMHAGVVYTRLLQWRDHVLSGAVELNDDERRAFSESRDESHEPVQFLLRTVGEHPSFLTEEGRDYFHDATRTGVPVLT